MLLYLGMCVCVCVPDNATKQQTMGASISSWGKSSTSFIYCIAGNGCGNYILQFVVKCEVCRFNV